MRMNSLYLEDHGITYVDSIAQGKKRVKRYSAYKKIVVVINKDTGEIKEYSHSADLANELGVSRPAISKKISNPDSKRKKSSHLSYRFMYKPFYFEKIEYRILVNHNGTKARLYRLWDNMTYRCTHVEFYPSYADVTYDESWEDYETFVRDISKIQGFKEWVANKEKYHIDKDIKIPGNKQYNKNTCTFVLGSENISESRSRTDYTNMRSPVIQYTLKGKYVAEYESITAAAKVIGRSNGAIQSCLSGKSKTCAGFKWSYKNK